MEPRQQKTKIYKGIACLETPSLTGHIWWYQGDNLGYTAMRIEHIKNLRHGVLVHGNREVLAVVLKWEGRSQLIALNLPRTDCPALKQRGLWPKKMPLPFPNPAYTPWPAAARKKPELSFFPPFR